MDIVSRKNERVTHFRKLASSREYRYSCGEYLCDGEKLYLEAVKWRAGSREVMTAGELPCAAPPGARVYTVTREVIEAASPLRTPQNIVFTVSMPEEPPLDSIRGAVILENTQDPGNVGTMMRTANALGVRALVLTGDCADIYNPKAVRASMGAVFRERAVRVSLDRLAELAGETPIYAAALRRNAQDIRRVDLNGAAVAIGNEGSGLSDGILRICAGSIIIPMRPECESLNAAAAAAIIMWEMARDNI